MADLLNIINCSNAIDIIKQIQAEIDGSIVINSEPSKDYVDDRIKPQLQQIQKQFNDLIVSTDENDTKYCQPCDLELTSIQHAAQHYAGRKHRNAVQNMGKRVQNDGRFGIGDAAKGNFTPVTPANSYLSATFTANGVQQNIPMILPKTCNSDKNVLCKVCNIYVSSAAVMEAHEKGVKHLRKLKLLSTAPAACNLPVADSVDKSIYGKLFIKQEYIPAEDLSMYRTPSGAYYCKACDINLIHEPNLKQHVSGKKHLKRELKLKQQAAIVENGGTKMNNYNISNYM